MRLRQPHSFCRCNQARCSIDMSEVGPTKSAVVASDWTATNATAATCVVSVVAVHNNILNIPPVAVRH